MVHYVGISYIHPPKSDETRWHGGWLCRTRRTGAEPQSQPCLNMWACWRNVRPPIARPSVSERACAVPDCAISQATIEDVDYRTPRHLDKALFQQLATCQWIKGHHGLLITGGCGIAKSWLACALAQKACRDGYTVYYARATRLFTDFELAHGDGRFTRMFKSLVNVDLLILDDFGPEVLSAGPRRDLMEIVEERHNRRSIVPSSSPASSRYRPGTMSSVSPHSPTPFSTASSTTPTALNSRGRQCGKSKRGCSRASPDLRPRIARLSLDGAPGALCGLWRPAGLLGPSSAPKPSQSGWRASRGCCRASRIGRPRGSTGHPPLRAAASALCGHSAARAGPPCGLRGRPLPVLPLNP